MDSEELYVPSTLLTYGSTTPPDWECENCGRTLSWNYNRISFVGDNNEAFLSCCGDCYARGLAWAVKQAHQEHMRDTICGAKHEPKVEEKGQ